MKIKFAGAAGGEVTGSKHLITFGKKQILLDCGMFQGRRKDSYEKNVNFLFDPTKVNSVILSHSHIDHSGDLPVLVKQGFKGPIYSTYATRDLCNYMLLDSAFIQEREAEYMEERRKKKKPNKNKEDEDVPILYNMEEAQAALQLFHSVGYEQSFVVEDGVVASFYDAGHVLGSSLVHMIFFDKKKKKYLRVCFSGDLGRRGIPILRDPQLIPDTDVLIIECTYGNRLHPPLQSVGDDLAFIVNKVISRGGKLIIPSFALERAQEIIYHLNVLRKENKIPSIPIYVDSPLAANISEVFRTHPECCDKDAYDYFITKGHDPFTFEQLYYTRSVEDSKALNTKTGPMIIISASGMCEHGRILHHLKNNIDNPKNAILIVGYQAENTLGRKLVNGEKRVNIFGDPYNVKADIFIMDAFSAHADRSDLIEYISRINGLKKIFLVHGEQKQIDAFTHALSDNGYKDVHTPALGEEIELDFE